MKGINLDVLRLALWLAGLVVFAVFESAKPRRIASFPGLARRFANISLFLGNYWLVRLAFGGAVVASTEYAEEKRWGFLNDVDLTWPVEFALGILILDLMLYISHAASHALPSLWRFHMVHHSDLDFDVTTSMRFHPVEELATVFYKIGIVSAVGLDAKTVLAYELLHVLATQFNHSNLKLSTAADSGIGTALVTPDFHRIHHSPEVEEANSNFGFVFPWWDKIFGTHRAGPHLPHNLMQVGLADYRAPGGLTLPSLLTMPVSPKLGAYSFKKEE